MDDPWLKQTLGTQKQYDDFKQKCETKYASNSLFFNKIKNRQALEVPPPEPS